MALRNTTTSFGSIAKFFHWLIALLIITLLIVGYLMDNISDFDTKFFVFDLHKLGGLTVLTLVVLRILWRFANPIPELPQGMPLWERFLEKAVKLLLYISILIMPISGWIFSTAANHAPYIGNMMLPAPGIPENKTLSDDFWLVHQTFAWVIISLLCLHIVGAFKHHFINKDNILRRMLPGKIVKP